MRVFVLVCLLALVGSVWAVSSEKAANQTNADVKPNNTVLSPEQVLNFFDSFEAYTAGMQLAGQTSNWVTWSGTTGGTDDPYVSNAQAHSGVNSVVIVQDNDLVKDFGPVTSGVWQISFQVYIPTGNSGYFNTLAEFTLPGTFNWGLEVYFDAGGDGRCYGGSGTPVTFSWTPDTWQEVVVLVDLDTDNAEFWFNGSMVHSWQWTLGASGSGSPLQLDANDFYGAAATDEMYMDDYEIMDLGPSVGIGNNNPGIPEEFALHQNFPNPFNPTTTISYSLKENARVTLKVYNTLGQLVKTLVNARQEAGVKTVQWDGTNELGAKVASGMYLYRIEANGFVEARKMILMK